MITEPEMVADLMEDRRANLGDQLALFKVKREVSFVEDDYSIRCDSEVVT